MASKKKIKFERFDAFPHREVRTSADVEGVMNSRWAYAKKLDELIKKSQTPEVEQAFRLALDILSDEIGVLNLLVKTKRRLEEPHIAAWVAMDERIEKLKEELDRLSWRVPEDQTY